MGCTKGLILLALSGMADEVIPFLVQKLLSSYTSVVFVMQLLPEVAAAMVLGSRILVSTAVTEPGMSFSRSTPWK